MTKRKSKIVKLVGTSYFRRIRVSSNSNRLVQFNKVPRVRIPLSPVGVGVKVGLVKKGLEGGFSGDMAVKVGLGIAREPLDHFKQLGLTPALLFDFGHIVWIYPSEGERGDAGVVFGSCVCGHGGWWFRYVLQLDALRVALEVNLDEVA